MPALPSLPIPVFATTCVRCYRLHVPRDPDVLSPVCLGCQPR